MTEEEFLQLLEIPSIEEKLIEIYKKIQNNESTQTLPVQEEVEEQKQAEAESEVARLNDMIQALREKLSGKEKELQVEKEISVKIQAENKGLQERTQCLQEEIAKEQRIFQEKYSSLEEEAKKQISSRDTQYQEKLHELEKNANATITALQGEISQMKEKNRDLTAKNTSLSDDFSFARGVISKFEKEQENFRLYQGFPDTIKVELKNVFRENTFENFIACCSQKETIESLWTFTKTRIFNDNLEYLKELSSIFAFSVHCHNSTWETPVIHLVEGKEGDRFNTLSHIGTPNSNKAGTVEEVLFSGYAVGKDMKVKQKAIVVVG